MTAVPAPTAAPARKKNVLGIVVLLVFAVLAIEALFVFGQKASGSVMAQPIVRFSGAQKETGPFNAYDVTGLKGDRLAFSDQGAGAILVFDLNGDFVEKIGKKGPGVKEFQEPSGISSDAEGNIYVMDTWNSAVKGVSPKGDVFLNIDLMRFKNFYGPRGLCYDGTNFLIADTVSHRIVKMSPSGTILAAWGKRGEGKGEFYNPTGVAVAPNGDICVVDADNHRVQILNGAGEPKKVIAVGAKLNDLAVDPSGRIFVSSTEGGFVKVYNPKGKLLGNLTDANRSADPFRSVTGMGITSDNILLCAHNDAISAWRLASSAGK